MGRKGRQRREGKGNIIRLNQCDGKWEGSDGEGVEGKRRETIIIRKRHKGMKVITEMTGREKKEEREEKEGKTGPAEEK